MIVVMIMIKEGFLLLIMLTFYIVTELSAVQLKFCAIQVI